MSGRRCDICGAENAPFGYAPPPRLGVRLRRALYTCASETCRATAEARRRALIEKHDPFAKARAPS